MTANEPRGRPPPTDLDPFERLGDGLWVVAPPHSGVELGEELATPPHGGAWLHLGQSGRVVVFTGKVDVGQGTRQAFARIVAGELGVAETRVLIVMGDTDRCPWDAGTFGSLATPTIAPLVRAVARRAAKLWWELAPGGSTACSIDAVGEALRGVRRTERLDDAAPSRTSSPPPSSRRPPDERRAEASRGGLDPVAVAMVTGARTYGSDLRRPGMLFGKLLRPPAHGATRRSLDTSVAESLSGVTVVVEGDFAGVAAPSPRRAEQAVGALHAEWERSPQPSEREVVEHLRRHPAEGDDAWAAMRHERGDVEAALERASVRKSATYVTAYVAHVPLECRCAVAEWNEGRLSAWVGTQRPFDVRRKLAEAFSIDESSVRVIVPPTGGGFGGKHTPEVALGAARLAKASGRPVRLAYDREEEFTWAYFRPMAIIDVRCGAASDGRLDAWSFENINAGGSAALTPYVVPHQRIVHRPCVSPLPQGSYRALAATANCFARESQMDELAAHFGIDPLEYRLRHLDDERMATVFRAVAQVAGFPGARRASGAGRGIAGGVEKAGRVAAVVDVRVDAERRLRLERITVAFECGAIVDPQELEKQVVGATTMGLGGALFEAIRFEDGRVLNPRLSGYRVPRFCDVPEIEVVLVDRPEEPSAGGGETPIIAVAPALANAIFDATGERLRELPLRSSRWMIGARG